jgi:outer membrane protein TolC
MHAGAPITIPCLLMLASAIVSGCATYQPLPLALDSQPTPTLDALQHVNPLPSRLSIEDVALLAVQNNPDLRAARAQRGVAQAQILEAGILPNPVLGGSYGFLLGGPGTTDPITVSLSQDLRSFVTRPAKRRSARQTARAADASLLWEEWQVVAKARLLAVGLIEGEQQLRELRRTVTLLAERTAHNHEALASGDSTLTSLLPDLTADAEARRQFDDIEHQQAARRRDLNILLSLAPQVSLPLRESIALPPIDADAVIDALGSIVSRRPDLLALQWGYQSQEEKVRGAILGQFPMFSLGGGSERDNTDVRTAGPQISLELPVFDRNQGNIAIERATRQQMHDEFTARLVSARSEVLALIADQVLLRHQLEGKRTQRAEIAAAAQRAEAAYRSGDLEERSYVDAVMAHSAKEQEVLTMEQTLLEQQVAIATLIGAGMPPAVFNDQPVRQ